MFFVASVDFAVYKLENLNDFDSLYLVSKHLCYSLPITTIHYDFVRFEIDFYRNIKQTTKNTIVN